MLSFKNNINSFLARTKLLHKQTIPYKLLHTSTTLKMPLVVPGITSGGDKSKTEEWTQKLVGKKIGESSDATVSFKAFLQHE